MNGSKDLQCQSEDFDISHQRRAKNPCQLTVLWVLVVMVSLCLGTSCPPAGAQEANCPDYCGSCIDRSHDYTCTAWYNEDDGAWTGEAKAICVTNYGTSPNIELVVGGCGQGSTYSSDTGVAYAFVKRLGTCEPPCCCDPPCCEEPNCIGPHPIGPNYPGSQTIYQTVIKIGGNREKFRKFFTHPGTRLPSITASSDFPGANTVLVSEANCEYTFPGNGTITIRCKAYNSEQDSGGSFPYTVTWYAVKISGCDLDYMFWHAYHKVSGAIKVKANKRTGFDPFNFKPSLSSGSGTAWIDRIERIYVDPSGDYSPSCNSNISGKEPQKEWSWAHSRSVDTLYDVYGYCDTICCEDEECDEPKEAVECIVEKQWFGEFYGDTTLCRSDYYRAKFPAWKKNVRLADLSLAPPSYMEGWGAYAGHFSDYASSPKYLSLSLGSLGTFYYHCGHKSAAKDDEDELLYSNRYLLSSIEYCTPGQSPGEGVIVWGFNYHPETDDLDEIVNEVNGSQFNFSYE